jgi:aspartyl-tRNA(Asn)/glutamyl-tRNA(Gln) amidotransferase subunit B
MEEGSLRCDANVSLKRPGDPKLGTKVELKNINSFKFVEQAIEHEIHRQTSVLDGGGQIVQETRLWDADRKTSHAMRSKEEAHDYRYFPDPDLPPLAIAEDWISRIQAALPELPRARRERFARDLKLPDADARVLTEERAIADWFESAAKGADPKKVANWIQGELFASLNREGKTIEQAPIRPGQLGELIQLIDAGTISGKIAKDVFARMLATGDDPKTIVEREGLVQVSDTGAIEAAAREIIAKNPKQAADYRAGKTNMLGFFVGQVMKSMGGKANPQAVNEILKRLLG